MRHDYNVFVAPTWTPQDDPDGEHDDQVRRRFAGEIAVMLAEHGQDYAAHLVRGMPVDGEWP